MRARVDAKNFFVATHERAARFVRQVRSELEQCLLENDARVVFSVPKISR
jgi:hypothetical protein